MVLPSCRTSERTVIVASVAVACVSVGFGGGFEDPCVALIRHFFEEWEIVPAEAGGVLPFVTVLVEPRDRHVVTTAILSFVFPDRGLDTAHADFVNRSSGGLSFISWHRSFLLVVLRRSVHQVTVARQGVTFESTAVELAGVAARSGAKSTTNSFSLSHGGPSNTDQSP